MPQFKDMNGKSWTVNISAWTIRKIKEAIDIDLTECVDKDMLEGLLNNVINFVNVLFLIVEDQAKEASITDEMFGKSLGGDNLGEAKLAFCEGMVNFFPDPLKRAAVKAALKKNREIQEAISKEVLERIETGYLEEIVEKDLTEDQIKDDIQRRIKQSLKSSGS